MPVTSPKMLDTEDLAQRRKGAKELILAALDLCLTKVNSANLSGFLGIQLINMSFRPLAPLGAGFFEEESLRPVKW
jgi:hypothetical protein